MPTVVPVFQRRRRGVRALARDQRPAAEAVRLSSMAIATRAARRPDQRADARARRAGARLRRRHGARHAGSEPGVPLGERVRRRGSSIGGWRPPASGWPSAGTIADVASCPGAEIVPAGGDAVARPRPAARGSPARAARSDRGRRRRATSRSAAARTAAASITSRRSASRAASAGSASRAVPQYFVMVGGGADARRRRVRPPGREDSGAPVPRGRRAADRALRARARRRRSARRVLPPRRPRAA